MAAVATPTSGALAEHIGVGGCPAHQFGHDLGQLGRAPASVPLDDRLFNPSLGHADVAAADVEHPAVTPADSLLPSHTTRGATLSGATWR